MVFVSLSRLLRGRACVLILLCDGLGFGVWGLGFGLCAGGGSGFGIWALGFGLSCPLRVDLFGSMGLLGDWGFARRPPRLLPLF